MVWLGGAGADLQDRLRQGGHRVAEPPAPYGAGTIPPPTPSPHQKLVIFTEHRDTLNYLEQRISTLLGRQEAVVVIHGGIGREERLKAQELFKYDPEVQVLLATDAASEGINLQRAHLMVNYDLPWNPNRIEQCFGRLHRIGQTEVCHLREIARRPAGPAARRLCLPWPSIARCRDRPDAGTSSRSAETRQRAG